MLTIYKITIIKFLNKVIAGIFEISPQKHAAVFGNDGNGRGYERSGADLTPQNFHEIDRDVFGAARYSGLSILDFDGLSPKVFKV